MRAVIDPYTYTYDPATNTHCWNLSFTRVASLRTLTEICKDADRYSDNSTELLTLMEEVKASELTVSQKEFAPDHINDKIEALRDKIRKGQARRRLDD